MIGFQRTPCRCKRCFTRKTLKRNPDHYIIIPACSCGSREWYVDNYRIKVEWVKSKLERCPGCIGYHFPHRKGGGWCVYNTNLDLSNNENNEELTRMNDFSHLWNDLPFEERTRLMPFLVEAQLRYIEQGKGIAIRAHKKYLSDVNILQKSLKQELKKYKGKD